MAAMVVRVTHSRNGHSCNDHDVRWLFFHGEYLQRVYRQKPDQ